LEHGKTVVIYVSIGPAPRPLPELTNLTVPDATAALQEIGLVLVEGDAVFSETVPVGVIVSWTVPSVPGAVAGDTVTKGTTVQVIASAGPAPRTVPNLTGFSLADATAALQALDLVVAQGPDEFSDTIPAGQVMRQDPGPDAALQIGATVTVVLSKGPDLVTVPPLSGLDYNGIVAALQSAGFTIGTASGDTNLQLTGAAVNGTAVGAGQQFPRGTKVDLFFATAPPATPAP
ncbi:MAG: PASTA domain-containing protein, partial [Ilumatobacteraceae bacterium]